MDVGLSLERRTPTYARNVAPYGFAGARLFTHPPTLSQNSGQTLQSHLKA